MSDMHDEWRAAAIETFASAWYRADGFRHGWITPRWELTDPVIRGAWLAAAGRYVAGQPLRKPKLRMEPRYAENGTRLNDEWVEKA